MLHFKNTVSKYWKNLQPHHTALRSTKRLSAEYALWSKSMLRTVTEVAVSLRPDSGSIPARSAPVYDSNSQVVQLSVV